MQEDMRKKTVAGLSFPSLKVALARRDEQRPAQQCCIVCTIVLDEAPHDVALAAADPTCCGAEQVRERIWRQTGDNALVARLVPPAAREEQLVSRAALLREALGQRLDILARR